MNITLERIYAIMVGGLGILCAWLIVKVIELKHFIRTQIRNDIDEYENRIRRIRNENPKQ